MGFSSFISLGLFPVAIFIAALLSVSQLSAGESDGPENLAGAIRSDQTREVFGGEKVEVVFHLIDILAKDLQTKADLLQIAGSIAAPILQNLSGTPGDLSGEVVRPWKFEFSLPEVGVESRFLLRFAVRETEDENWRVAGRLHLIAHPQNLLQPIVDFSKEHSLYLVKDFPQLADLFASRKIETESVDNIERTGSGLFFALDSEIDSDSVLLHRDQVLVIFQKENSSEPKFTLYPSAEGRILLVPQSILIEIDSQPRKQLDLLKVFELARQQLIPLLAEPF